MLSFENDYGTGAHPEVLKRLLDTNEETLSGYGADNYTLSAAGKIRQACCCPDAQIAFLAGGTQTNAVVISAMLRDYEGVIAPASGHINAHEAGAIEYTGHKVLALPHAEGKLEADTVDKYLSDFFADPSHEHMVFPGMVCVSHPTEYGTIYSSEELERLSAVCR